MITKHQIKTVREQIQDDLLCLLDGLPQEAQTIACQIVVDKLNLLLVDAED